MDKGIAVESSERGKFLWRAVLLLFFSQRGVWCVTACSLMENITVGNAFNKEEQKKLVIEATKIFPYIRDKPKGPLQNKQDTIKHDTMNH